MSKEQRLINHIMNCIKDADIIPSEKIVAIKCMIEVYDGVRPFYFIPGPKNPPMSNRPDGLEDGLEDWA